MTNANTNGRIINVLTVVDSETLYKKVQDGTLLPGTADNPTSIGNYGSTGAYLSMITQHNNVTNNPQGKYGQGKSELSITCDVGDTIEWSIVSFDMNTNQTPYLYGGTFKCLAPVGATPGIETPLSFSTNNVTNYLPSNGNPIGQFKKVTNTIVTTSAAVNASGQTLQYSLAFTLINNANGSTIGYFSWDPFILINPLG